jgi:signal transduction histidine kinase
MHRDTLHLLLGLAHELRTPISAIAGHASLLSMGVHGPVSEAQAESLRRIQHNQQQLLSLISDVVQYAEAASGIVELRRERLSLWPLVLQAADAVRANAESRGVRLEAESPSPDASDDAALLDPAATRTVLDAMLEHVVANSARDSVIRVSMAHTDQLLHVNVRGTGIAATTERPSTLLTPFARDDVGRPVYAGGHALALPLAGAMARAMGAELRVIAESAVLTLQFEVQRAANLRSGVG